MVDRKCGNEKFLIKYSSVNEIDNSKLQIGLHEMIFKFEDFPNFIPHEKYQLHYFRLNISDDNLTVLKSIIICTFFGFITRKDD